MSSMVNYVDNVEKRSDLQKKKLEQVPTQRNKLDEHMQCCPRDLLRQIPSPMSHCSNDRFDQQAVRSSGKSS